MDSEYFNVLNGNINFSLTHKEYIDLISDRANKTVRPITLRMRMKQMKDKMNEEINLSKIKHEQNLFQQSNDAYCKNIFFLYKKRRNVFNNKQIVSYSESRSPLAMRNSTQCSPKKQQQFNKTMLPLTPIIQHEKTKQQQYQDYIQINQQIQKHKGELNQQILQLLEKKVHIAKSLKQSCTKFGVNSYLQALKTIQVLKYKIAINETINQNVIKQCDNALEAQNSEKYFQEKTYTLFLKFLDVMQEMDDQISQYMLNYQLKNEIHEHNQILQDINQMRDDAYNEKVRTFSKYHDIDQEKKRDRQKLNKIKIYF